MAAPRKIKATISTIKRFADGVTSFTMKPESKCRFRSGQFLHLSMEPYDPSFNWPDSRVFSIASSPEKGDVIEILVSPKGKFTRKMVRSLQEGQEVWLKLPYGDFNYNHAVGADVILIAGGTGISPFVPFLEELPDHNLNYNSVNLFYGVRKRELVIFNVLFDKLKSSVSNFHFYLSVEEEPDGAVYNNSTGKLNLDTIFKKTHNLPKAVFYISGPKEMIKAVLSKAEIQGINPDSIFYDKWE